MKKFWSLMLVALVTLGAAACSEKDENVDTKQEATVSFYAEFADDTRADLVANGENSWKTTFTSGDVLWVNDFEFTHNGEKFVCNAEGVQNIIGTEVTINGNFGNSTTGKNAVKIAEETVTFESGMSITLESQLSFFMFNYTGELTLTASENIFKKENNAAATEITLTAEGETFVAFYPTGNNTTISYSIDGVKCKETTKTFETARVYNLGDLTPTYKVYVLPQPKSSISKWTKYNLYTWVTDGIGLTWPGEDITSNTEEINGYTYYVYEYSADYTGQTVNLIVNNGTTQTADIELGVLNTDYYIVVKSLSDSTIYTTAPASGSIEEAAVVEDPKPDTVSVYLSTTWGWSPWRLYAWGGTGTWGNYNSWPGVTKYDQVIDGVTYKAWDIPASCVGTTGTKIIINGSENGEDKQSADFPVTFTEGKDVFVTISWNGTTSSHDLSLIDSPYTE